MTDKSSKVVTRTSLVNEADGLVTGDRHNDYGEAADNFKRIGVGWGVILGSGPVPAWKVALCMDWLKTCRVVEDPSKQDSWVDKIGYSALGGEVALNKKDD